MVAPSRFRGRRHGTAVVELAVLLTFLIPLLLFGLWEVGRMVEVSQILSNAAREGARQASTGQLTDTQVATVVKKYLQNEGLPTQNVVVHIDITQGYGDQPPPDNNPANAFDLNSIQVRVDVPFQDVQWISGTFFSDSTTRLSGSAVWSSMKDMAYPVPTPPPGS
jgi:Flp pilus assembly protein TadG